MPRNNQDGCILSGGSKTSNLSLVVTRWRRFVEPMLIWTSSLKQSFPEKLPCSESPWNWSYTQNLCVACYLFVSSFNNVAKRHKSIDTNHAQTIRKFRNEINVGSAPVRWNAKYSVLQTDFTAAEKWI